jgi:hypothetical protein
MNIPQYPGTAAKQLAFKHLETALAHLESALQTGIRSRKDQAAHEVEQARAEAAQFLPHNQRHP